MGPAVQLLISRSPHNRSRMKLGHNVGRTAILLAALSLAGCALFTPDRLTRTPIAGAEAPWLYRGSNVPQDKAWRFGELDNGVRYAIRRNAVPPGQLSIRVRIDAGSLMERDDEQGFAHFIEHLSFRGSAHVPDGEAKRIWQRLGATFGSDSNAQTTPTGTTYQLDLPQANFAGVDESLKILAGMMAEPAITDAVVASERAVILAENREQPAPAVAVGDAARTLFFSGQLLGDRAPIGSVATLNGATAASLSAFHRRWYRPRRTTVIISGSGDPATIETLVQRHFGSWRVDGTDAPDPDFGDPDPAGPRAAALVEPALPATVQLGWLRPWRPVADTVAYNRGLMVTALAERMLNRRLEDRARAGADFLTANIDQRDVSRSADATFMTLVAGDGAWQRALTQAREVIAQAVRYTPTRAEIDREADAFELLLRAAVDNAAAEPSADQADDLAAAVDIRETVTSAEGALAIFRLARRDFTPLRIRAATRALFDGVPPRVLLTLPSAQDGASASALALLDAPVTVRRPPPPRVVQPASFAALPGLGHAGKVVERRKQPPLALESVRFANNVSLLLLPNKAEAGKVYVALRFGRGRAGLPADTDAPLWSAPALVASGIGPYGSDALDRLATGRQVGLDFSVGDDAYQLFAETRAADLRDQLRLMTAKLAAPGWDAVPVKRMKAQLLAGLGTFDAAPEGVLARDFDAAVRNGDRRWATPGRAAIEALTPASFRAFWAPRLTEGPVEVLIFGDFDADAAVAAARRTIATLAPRATAPADGTPVGFPAPRAEPLLLRHRGSNDQAAVVIAWPTAAGPDAETERALEVLAAIIGDRLFDELRTADGASYSPRADSQWSQRLPGTGHLLIAASLPPDRVETMLKATRAIAADLATREVDADEFARAVGPVRQYYQRAFSGNTFLLRTLAGLTNDPGRMEALRAIPRSLQALTPAKLREVAARYLTPGGDWSVVVLPEGAR